MRKGNDSYHKQLIASEPTLRRLPNYLHLLQQILLDGNLNISAPTIGRELNCDPTQVVKDLSVTGVKGKPKVGYNIYELIKAIESYLGFNKVNEAFLVGAGNLGKALMSYQEGQGLGLKILAAFDVSEHIVGKKCSGIQVLHMDQFMELSKRLGIKIGIIATPAEAAQDIADSMVKSGIRAIWNLSPSFLKLPNDIVVQNTTMYSNVAIMLHKLNQNNRELLNL